MRPPRSDLADNLMRTYNALWRHAHARHTARFRLTHRQLIEATGYLVPDYIKDGRERKLTSLVSYLTLLEEAGVVRWDGRDDLADGRSSVVTLLEPPEPLPSAPEGRRSSAGRALHS